MTRLAKMFLLPHKIILDLSKHSFLISGTKCIITLWLHILCYEVKIMIQLKFFTIIGAIFVLITGTLAHFLYRWSGNNTIVGLFVPINESIWEHMKLLFFPMLLCSVVMVLKFRKEYPCIAPSFCFGILAGTLLIPVLYYAYTYILGKNYFILDISIFILSVLAAFWFSYRLTLSCKLMPYTFLLYGLFFIFFASFLVFTYYPPELELFKDQAVSG